MARRTLIIGGTRFFGKRLVPLLRANGDEVTVLSRNLARGGFGSDVRQLSADREDKAGLARALGQDTYDLVYDQICYGPKAAAELCELLDGRVGRLVHTSTQSVYLNEGLQREADFDPATYPLRLVPREEVDYAEGKRLAEACHAQRAPFEVACVRLPYVVGPDDYLRRLHFHVEHILTAQPFQAPSLQHRMSFVHAQEAAEFLFWIGNQPVTGAWNVAAKRELTLSTLIEMIERTVGREAVLREADADRSPYSQDCSRYMDVTKAERQGFRFAEIERWMPELIAELVRLTPRP